MNERYTLGIWRGRPTSEERVGMLATGRPQPPTILLYNVTLTPSSVTAEIVTQIRELKPAKRTLTLTRPNGEKTRVKVFWDCTKAARYGDAAFEVTE